MHHASGLRKRAHGLRMSPPS